MKVLVAHGEALTREHVRELLEPLGWQVEVSATATDALSACGSWHPDVALVQGSLCEREDFVLLSEIKGLASDGFRTAVILMDRDLDVSRAVEELRRGAHDFLFEPVQDAELIARVGAAARTKSLQDELLTQAQRLEQLIFEDPLTGLLNRRAILAQLDALLSGARRHGRAVSIAILDIDHFKIFNDTHGHHVGDRVLTAVSVAVRDRLRGEDWLGRLGGEELLAILPDTDVDDAARVIEDLRATVSQLTVEHEVGTLGVTVSAGFATWNGEAREDLLSRADHALYAAKGAGRNAVRAASGDREAATLRPRS